MSAVPAAGGGREGKGTCTPEEDVCPECGGGGGGDIVEAVCAALLLVAGGTGAEELECWTLVLPDVFTVGRVCMVS